MSYVRGRGLFVVLPGFTVLLPATMSLQAAANHLRELRELYG